jgi:hypothetical protein
MKFSWYCSIVQLYLFFHYDKLQTNFIFHFTRVIFYRIMFIGHRFNCSILKDQAEKNSTQPFIRSSVILLLSPYSLGNNISKAEITGHYQIIKPYSKKYIQHLKLRLWPVVFLLSTVELDFVLSQNLQLRNSSVCTILTHLVFCITLSLVLIGR